ncbi:hypothetical protein [Herbaspirillum sp. CF444]|uniref:hypothetical protein n=1 Tax=Herbaspirillum sp. CF444 TaxID=1144319 RepID=UPI00054FEF1E|nr:hypothetical protein [Herbaspirillum sp. CF444]
MKSLDHPSIGQRAATLFSAAPAPLIVCLIFVAAVLAVALCSIFFPRFLSFAMPFVQAGIVISIAAGLLSAGRNKALQLRRRFVPIKIRRRD